ncbi:hypothetical protein EFM54_00315 [Lentilactobacillus buchneri]|nr:hypothetical protein [Lentilactobacillus buchneri]
MPPVMFSVITKYHKGRHSLFLYNSEIFYAFTQDILRSPFFRFRRKRSVDVFSTLSSIHRKEKPSFLQKEGLRSK